MECDICHQQPPAFRCLVSFVIRRIEIANKANRPLISLLKEDNAVGQKSAASTLWNLALNAANRAIIVKEGGIPFLLELVRNGCMQQSKTEAAGVVKHISGLAENQVKIAEADDIGPLIALLYGGEADGKMQATVTLKNLAREDKTR